jgi:predicted porin
VNGPLEVRYAGQDRKEAAAGSAVSGSNPGAVGTNTFNASTGVPTTVAATPALNKKTNVLGGKYTFGQYTLAAAYISNEAAAAFGGAMVKKTGTQIGLGYTTGPWTLGTSLTSAESSSLLNVQARYALSKRTNLIAMYGSAKNDANGTVKFLPTAFNTGSAPAVIVNGFAGTAGVTQTALGLGITHSF